MDQNINFDPDLLRGFNCQTVHSILKFINDLWPFHIGKRIPFG